MSLLTILGDVLWIIALSLMAGASRGAFKRIPKEVTVPLQWSSSGAVVWRAPRAAALLFIPTAAFVIGLGLKLMDHNALAVNTDTLVLFGVRATIPAILAILHLRWIQAAMKALADEGRLTPL